MPVGGIQWDTEPGAPGVLDAIQNWVETGSGLLDTQVMWGGQDTNRPPAPAITLRISNISELGTMWTDYETNVHSFDDIVVTADAGTNAFTAVAHGRLTGDGPVRLEGADVPAGTVIDHDYWVIKLTNDTFQLAESFQDAVATVPVFVDLTDAGTGTIELVDTPSTVRRGEELAAIARGMVRMTIEVRCHSTPVIGPQMAVAILQRVRTRREWTSQQDILDAANITVQDVERILAITTQRRDDFKFEPFATMNVHLCATVEEAEYLTIIERVYVTDEISEPDVEFVVP